MFACSMAGAREGYIQGRSHGGGMPARAGGSGGPDLQNSSSEPIFNSSKTEEKLGGLWTRGLIFWSRVLAPDMYGAQCGKIQLSINNNCARETFNFHAIYTLTP
jgi:hypothetical protein